MISGPARNPIHVTMHRSVDDIGKSELDPIFFGQPSRMTDSCTTPRSISDYYASERDCHDRLHNSRGLETEPFVARHAHTTVRTFVRIITLPRPLSPSKTIHGCLFRAHEAVWAALDSLEPSPRAHKA